MGVVTLDQVRVIAIHRTNQIPHGEAHDGVQQARELAGFSRQVEREVLQDLRAFGRHERLGGGGPQVRCSWGAAKWPVE